MRQSKRMTKLGREILVNGDLQAADDLVIEGQIDGAIWCDGFAVTIAPDARVTGDVIARDITVHGTLVGTLMAREVVDIRPEAVVTGRVVSTRFILNDGASFNGSATPQHLEAALVVARHRRHMPPEPQTPPTRRQDARVTAAGLTSALR
jgi:cytoskeletal protein CcmA (bactofilin family)